MLCGIKLVCIDALIVQAPFAAVAAFGLYSIAAVLYGVFTFRDCPEEAASLHKVAASPSSASSTLYIFHMTYATADTRCAVQADVTSLLSRSAGHRACSCGPDQKGRLAEVVAAPNRQATGASLCIATDVSHHKSSCRPPA